MPGQGDRGDQMNQLLHTLLPVEIVLHPSWWAKHAQLAFDADFYYHPIRRVEAERHMENVLHERFGHHGLGGDHGKCLPVIGAVHNAAGYLISEMLGCEVRYVDTAAPQVLCAERDHWSLDVDSALSSPAFKRFERLCDALKTSYGYLVGDVNWSGILNVALDIWGQRFLTALMTEPAEAQLGLEQISVLIDRFTRAIAAETGSTSISVNRMVRHLGRRVFLHSECSLNMLSTEHYERFLMRYDWAWSLAHPNFGIHYCGSDPHRFATQYAQLPRLDFLDVGWGGDVAALRRALPQTFLNIRLSPVEIAHASTDQIQGWIVDRVHASNNPWLTGVCCVNMDDTVSDDRIDAIFDTVAELRQESIVAAREPVGGGRVR